MEATRTEVGNAIGSTPDERVLSERVQILDRSGDDLPDAIETVRRIARDTNRDGEFDTVIEIRQMASTIGFDGIAAHVDEEETLVWSNLDRRPSSRSRLCQTIWADRAPAV